MADGRRGRTRHKRRNRDLLGAVLVVALAAVIGLIAGVVGEPKPWMDPQPTDPTIVNQQPQGSP